MNSEDIWSRDFKFWLFYWTGRFEEFMFTLDSKMLGRDTWKSDKPIALTKLGIG